MQHVLFLEGSPRVGNTSQIADWVIAGLGRGVKVNRVRLMEKAIHECQECFSCAKCKTGAGCSQADDDMPELYDLIVDADLVVWTSPVFCWSVTGVVKTTLDRCFALLTGEDLLKGAKWALVLTAGGDHYDGADLAVQMFRRLARYAGIKHLGEHVVANCPDGKRLTDNAAIRAAAVAFGRKLAKSLRES